ncbi:prepilin-type N-terminal cleavage/methylation domain-containing protein [Xanthobacter sp. V4C-4]|uniref:PulJ/GspJ family protein n=1 Tax=Xanthobacter cornucopiae TaxID=3119924 RepID=UPI003728321D
MRRGLRRSSAGFTLVEVLVALALAGLVVSALATLTRQWLPNWRRGFERVEAAERVGLALGRVAADLSVVEAVPASLERPRPLFDGAPSSITFVRTALGPHAPPGLEIVRLGPGADGAGLVRSAAPYAPRRSEEPLGVFGAPVRVLGAAYRLDFSYSGRDGLWLGSWSDLDELPRAVRVVVRDGRTGRALDVSTVVVVRAELPADCVSEATRQGCGAIAGRGAAGPGAGKGAQTGPGGGTGKGREAGTP